MLPPPTKSNANESRAAGVAQSRLIQTVPHHQTSFNVVGILERKRQSGLDIQIKLE